MPLVLPPPISSVGTHSTASPISLREGETPVEPHLPSPTKAVGTHSTASPTSPREGETPVEPHPPSLTNLEHVPTGLPIQRYRPDAPANHPEVALDLLSASTAPVFALAPMQDVTDLPFWNLLAGYGGADLYFTEYFRVYATSVLDKNILRSVTENAAGRPIVAQMIGEDIPALVRTARELQTYPIVAVDLNLGCPAPIVCRKNAGGGLLRDLNRLDSILGALRESITIRFSVKTRLGYDSAREFEQLLPLLAKHGLDLLTVHGRTVKDMYRGRVDYALIAQAVAAMPCPVLANGDVNSAAKAVAVLQQTHARGVMIGRAAIANPWLFSQIRQALRGEPIELPTGREVAAYLRALYDAVRPPGIRPADHVKKMKKYLNFIGPGIEPTGQFLYQARRMVTESDFESLCATFLDHDQPMTLDPDSFSFESPHSSHVPC